MTGIGLEYDRQTDLIRTPVQFEVEPERIQNTAPAEKRGPLENARFLVAHGMRAQIKSTNLLTGQMEVALEFFPNAPPAEITDRREYDRFSNRRRGVCRSRALGDRLLVPREPHAVPADRRQSERAAGRRQRTDEQPGTETITSILDRDAGKHASTGQAAGCRCLAGAPALAGNRQQPAGMLCEHKPVGNVDQFRIRGELEISSRPGSDDEPARATWFSLFSCCWFCSNGIRMR